MEFSPTRDVDSAANDVRDRVSGAVDDLPEEALAPEIRKVDADARPIMFFIISKPGWSRLQLSDYVDRNIADRFSAIDGVARVFIGGEAKPSRSEERRVGNECVSTCRSRGSPDH